VIRSAIGLARRGHDAWRTGKLKLFLDYIVLASGQLVGKLVGFVAFAYLARVLDPSDYGAVEYVVGLAVYATIVVDAGLDSIGVRRALRSPASLSTLAYQIPVARLAVAMVCIPAMGLFANSAMKGGTSASLIWLFALSLLTAPWRQEWLLQATERMTEAAIAQVLRAVVFASAVWALIRAPKDLIFVGWAEIASVIAATAYCLWIQHTRIAPIRVRGSLHGLGGLMNEGARQGVTNLVWATNQAAPLFLVGAMLGSSQVAWFGAAGRVIGSLLTFNNLYHFNLYPAVARAAANDTEALKRLMRRSFRVTSWAGVAVALAITLFAQPLTLIVFGPKLGEAAPLLALLAWTFPIGLASGHPRWGLTAIGAQTSVAGSQLVGLAVLLVACPLLGLTWGVMGVAVGSILSALAVWGASHVMAARRGAHPPPMVLASRPVLLAAALMAAQVYFAPPGWWVPAIELAAFVLAAPLLDRKLVFDLAMLGRSKQVAAPEEPSTAG
jgi:O-antigen/teichoic acid export membrane protein